LHQERRSDATGTSIDLHRRGAPPRLRPHGPAANAILLKRDSLGVPTGPLLTASVSCKANQLRPFVRIRDFAEEFQELQSLSDKYKIGLLRDKCFIHREIAEEIADRDC
jgi:hypothetical protein